LQLSLNINLGKPSHFGGTAIAWLTIRQQQHCLLHSVARCVKFRTKYVYAIIVPEVSKTNPHSLHPNSDYRYQRVIRVLGGIRIEGRVSVY
jgi:hypothetical protein